MAETRVYLWTDDDKTRQWGGGGGGGGGGGLFSGRRDRQVLVSVNRDVLKNCAVNVIEVHSVINNTYIEDQSKKINR